MSESRILVIDADAPRAERLAGLLEFMDLTPRWVASAGDVDVRRQRPHDWLAVVVGTVDDQKAADAFFAWLGKAQLPPPVLLLEGDTAAFAAAHGLHEAGVWTLESPIRHAQLEACLRRASLKRLDTEHQAQQVTTSGPTGNSPAVTRLRRMIEQVASFDTTVLVLGESGTGKEVVARAIHDESPRRDGPFVAINCGAIPPDLLESELFGHEKGAFTGAVARRIGKFEEANGGTLLLDEVTEMHPSLQAKLLRALQEKTVRPVGGEREEPVDVRIIAATHRNLEKEIEQENFRSDLFYRLETFSLRIPPLRERGTDVEHLIFALIDKHAESQHKQVEHIEPEALNSLLNYTYPGNVRELENAIMRAVTLSEEGLLKHQDLPERLRDQVHQQNSADPTPTLSGEVLPGTSAPAPAPARWPSLEEVEKRYIRKVLEATGGNKRRTAEVLGIARRTLYRRLEDSDE